MDYRPMTADEVEKFTQRLRNFALRSEVPLCDRAADALEAQQRLIAKLTVRLETEVRARHQLRVYYDGGWWSECCAAWVGQQDGLNNHGIADISEAIATCTPYHTAHVEAILEQVRSNSE